MSDIKPCPFCGNDDCEVEYEDTRNIWCYVECGYCGANNGGFPSVGEAISNWNNVYYSMTKDETIESIQDICINGKQVSIIVRK